MPTNVIRLRDAFAPDREVPCAPSPAVPYGTHGRLQDARSAGAELGVSEQAALAVDRVFHRYGTVEAVNDVSLAIGPGEIVCLLGPSGCGKSTLLRIAAGLEPLQSGRVTLGGRVVAGDGVDYPPERRGIGMVFQDFALFPHLTVWRNVLFGLNKVQADHARSQAGQALEIVGMSDYANAYPHELSGGQQQRVALARAMAPKPPVLLLDEPFSGLDARLRDQVRDETLHVLQESGAAVLLVTHDSEEAMFLADRIALMRDGRLVQTGSPSDLYSRPVNGFAAAFFGVVNRFEGVVHDGAVATPLGLIPSPTLSDGVEADVLVRPEAVHLVEPDGGATVMHIARVEAARPLGRSSLVHLGLTDPNGHTAHIHSRITGNFLPRPKSHVGIFVNHHQTFVFPRD